MAADSVPKLMTARHAASGQPRIPRCVAYNRLPKGGRCGGWQRVCTAQSRLYPVRHVIALNTATLTRQVPLNPSTREYGL
jgi:hypothetical protein